MKKMLSTRTPYERDLADSRAKLRVTEKLRHPTCDSCGGTVTFWLPPESPEPDEHGRAMTWAKKCEHCGALVTMTLEARVPEASVHVQGEWEAFTHYHLGHEPVLIESRQQFRRELKARGLRTDAEG